MTDLVNWDYRKNKGIVWCYPVNKKDKGFMVRQGQEIAIWLQKGRLLDVIMDGYSHEFQKSSEKEGSELIYIKSGEVRLQWGIPMRNGIVTADQIMIGCHGVLTLKISSPQDFIFHLVSTETCVFIEDLEKEVFLKDEKKKDEVIKKSVQDETLKIQDAKRSEEPYLFTQQDMKKWILPILKQVLREKFASSKLDEVKAIDAKELEQQLRIIMNKEIGKWGLELISFTIIGWNIPSR